MATYPKTSIKSRANLARSKSAMKTLSRTPRAKTASGAAASKQAGRGKRTGTTGQRATKGAAKEAAPSSLRPIRTRQSRADILAMVAAESGATPHTVESVARSLSRTLTRHLIRGGSGRVEIPYLGAALWRERRAAQKARIMHSPALGRDVKVPSRPAQAAPRLRAHRALRDVVART